MNDRCHDDLLARARKVLVDAKRAGVAERDRRVVAEEIGTRQRAVRAAIHRRRDGAVKLRLRRRPETIALLVKTLDRVRREAIERRDLSAVLDEALKATGVERPDKPIRTPVEQVLAYRRAPLRFIIEYDTERVSEDAANHLSRVLGVRFNARNDSLPSVEPLFRRPDVHRYFVVTIPLSQEKGARRRFLIAKALKDRARLTSVQPSELITLTSSVVDFTAPPPPLDTEWPLATMNVRNGWDLTPAGRGRSGGAGETIGHLDSGWFDHPEYDRVRLDLARAYNASTDSISETAAAHSFEGGFNETHGLATGSIMVSAPAPAEARVVTVVPTNPGEPGPAHLAITGVAPEARVLPVRCLDFVFMLPDNVDLVRGAEYLIEPEDPSSPAKVGVVSMSLGGIPHFTLEEVLNVGVRDKNVIAVAAAGQVYAGPLPVAAPAAYPEVIAVAASTPTDEPAHWTFAGPEIDVAAPGEGVWVADTRGEEQDDGSVAVNRFVGYGHGTSFSCAFGAGVAALWRAFYADEFAEGTYGDIPLARVFRQHLRQTARRPEGWDTSRFGTGIIDVEALLATPLPAPDEVPLPASVQPFNPFVGLEDAFEGLADAWDGLVSFTSELGSELAAAGRDAWNEGMVVLSDLASQGGAIVDAARVIGLKTAEDVAQATAGHLADVWGQVAAFADAAGDEIGRRAADVADALADAWEGATEAAEGLAEDVAEAVEETAEDVVEAVEEIAEEAGEAVDDVVDAFIGLFS